MVENDVDTSKADAPSIESGLQIAFQDIQVGAQNEVQKVLNY